MLELIASTSCKNTEKANRFATKIFNDFLSASGSNFCLENIPISELAIVLPKFYASVRNTKGELYSSTTLLSLRASLNRSLAATRVPCFDISKDPDFRESNRIFKAIMKKTRMDGKGQVKHKAAIDEADIRKVYEHPEVFNIENPRGLQNKVFFELSLYFCRRGRENLHLLKRDEFAFRKDDSGREYVVKTSSESDKNHPGERLVSGETEGGRMYATQYPNCPVASFRKYVSKLHPSCDRLFQRARNGIKQSDSVWYENKPLGVNTIGNKMKEISGGASLSRSYTNHSIRATCITTLSTSGFEGRHIRTVSGQKSDKSLDSYTRETSTSLKRAMSTALSSAALPRDTIEPQPPTGDRDFVSTSAAVSSTAPEAVFDLVPDWVDRPAYCASSSVATMNQNIRKTLIPGIHISATNVHIHFHQDK